MKNNFFALILLLHLGLATLSCAADEVSIVKKAVERSTLNQNGTKPFHLKATLAPSFARDSNSGRSGEVEIWWMSPAQWKREVRCSTFHQVAIVNGNREWQRNEGEYFPEWLRNIAVELVEPVPRIDEVLEHAKGAQHLELAGTTHLSWVFMASNGNAQKGIGAGVDISGKTGLLDYASGLGWGAAFSDYKDFHGRMVALKVAAGTPEVTAKVDLEDLGNVSDAFFGAPAEDGDRAPIRTEVVKEPELRKNLSNGDAIDWPPVKDGPLEGLLTAEIVVDRSGNVREVGSVLSDNPAVSETASKAIWGRHFQPYLVNGQPVQVISTFTLPFKAVRPPDVDNFDSARTYFESGRKAGFPAFGGTSPPYSLQATFKARLKSGTVEDGVYTDIYKSSREWRREATIGKSRYLRSQHGEKRYQLAEGPDAALLRLILEFTEPIPVLDSFYEADWRIRRDTVASVRCVRVAAGYESPSGDPDPEQFRGFWFDEHGNLVKTYLRGIETRRTNFFPFDAFQVAKEIQVLQSNALVMIIRVNQISPAGELADSTFELKGHDWVRAFTAEMR